jgi:site-specific recombinase XerD
MSIAWESINNNDRNNNANNNSTKARGQHRRYQPIEVFSSDSSSKNDNTYALNQKIKSICKDLLPSIQRLFLEFPTDKDRELVADFLLACIQQENIALATKEAYLKSLFYLSEHFDHKKSFKEDMTDRDITDYLSSLHKDRALDPDQGWINTHNQRAMVISKFFKWVAYPHLSPEQRRNKLSKDQLPPVLRGLTFVSKKGSKSSIKARDIWTDEDTAIFLKYCAGWNPRLACFHAMARDTSARPSEILAVKLGDIEMKMSADGKLFVPLDVGRYGKKKKSRIVGMTDSIKYYRAWLQHHPASGNSDAFVFISREYSARYGNNPILGGALRADYRKFRTKYIPTLMKRPDIPPEDKIKVQHIKDNKKWNPYAMWHSSITRLARNPNINEYTLRQYAGWTKTSNMIEVYTHELKGESFEDVMMAYGIELKDKKETQQLQEELAGRICPYCKMQNLPDAQFCSQCEYTSDPEAFLKVKEEAEKNKKEAEENKKTLEEIKSKHEDTKKELKDLFESRQEQFEKYMKDMLEARSKLNSPAAALLRLYVPKNDPAFKALQEIVQEEEEKIKRDLRNNVPTV